jgi:broad specificity phosphatase PhoE
MELILARHGNTFKAGDPVVWVGSRNDLPLVESGCEQAKQLSKKLMSSNFVPTSVYTGPLLRMTAYAGIILSELKLSIHPKIDLRLNEIDYGQWSGLSTQEVCDKYGKEEYENWEKYSIWPKNAGWAESEQLLKDRIRAFTSDLIKHHSSKDKILVVASNGCLRYFLDLIPGELQKRINDKSVKIATGKMCQLHYDGKEWRVNFWNE